MIGKTISHYEILEELGRGGMGVVYKARDTTLDRYAAIKFLPPHLSSDEESTKRSIHEARAASALDHPSIATIYDVGQTSDGKTYIVMAYYEGETLRERIDRGLPSIAEAIGIVYQIASGLSKAHGKGIVHRDIKPSNVIITPEAEVKIIDFGLAKLAGKTRLTKEGSTLGTAAYMSPEQALGEELDHRSDIFSLGTIFYELVTGELPFKGEHEAALLYEIVHEEPKPVASLRSEVPEKLAAVIDRALSKNREERYPSAADLLNDLRPIQRSLQPDGLWALEPVSLARLIRRPRFAVPAIVLVLAIAALVVWWQMHRAKVRWARQIALSEIERLTEHIPWTGEGPETWQAFELATKAEQYIPDDPLLMRLWPQFSQYLKVRSDPSSANVYAKPYGDVESDWRYMGETPIDSIRFPGGYSRIKLEKAGFRTVYDLIMLATYYSYTREHRYRLFSLDSLPEDMEYMPGSKGIRPLVGLTHQKEGGIEAYLMDRYEVTNNEYARFVDNGGYEKSEYWKYPIVKDGKELTREDAMKLFVDKTGRPGPSTWEVGDYPEGEGEHPVAGVSWYEAAAYAEFAGKRLPTIYHWARPAAFYANPAIIPFCNMPGEGTVPVGSSQSMNRFGIYDLAGNVREWCFNKSSLGRDRFILGGGWDDPEFAFQFIYAQDPFDRSRTNGFRCMRLIGSDENYNDLENVVELAYRDFEKEPRISKETFRTFLKQYDYDKTELDAEIEWVREEEDWIREKITFDAAYGGERVIVYLYLPKDEAPPYKTVVYFPGVGALWSDSNSEEHAIPFKVVLRPASRGFLTKSGYAVLYPVYKSTFERDDDYELGYADTTHFHKEHVIMWVKDLKRSIDYLETRDDIDSDRIAYFGYSWGSTLGAIMAAVEPRIKASVLFVVGLELQRALPEVEPANYLPYVTSPVLMLNGEWDFYFPYETTQVPFFELLGTRPEDKELSLHKSSHLVPNTVLIRETLDWLDRYLESR